jgi:hypothetical protein
MRLFLLILCTTCLFTFSEAQRKKERDTSAYLTQPDRVEFQKDRLDVDFTIINGEQDGLLVVKQTRVKSEKGFGWNLYKLDTTLNNVWNKLLIIPTYYTYKGWDYSKGKYYLLFGSAQYNPEEFTIYEIDGVEGEIEEYEMSTVFPMILSHFEVIDNTVLLAGETNFKPAVLTFDLEEKKPKVIPGIYGEKGEILDIFMNDEDGLFTIVMLEKMINRYLTVNVKTYTSDNVLIQDNKLNPGERRSLIDGAPTNFSAGFQYIAGAYSAKSIQFSRGLYLAKYVQARQQFIRYYNYAELKNFFEYLGDGRKRRIQERIAKRKSRGKNSKFNYRLLVHEIIPRGNEFIMIGEAYYPRYSNYAPMMPYGIGMQSYRRNRYGGYTNIIGYKYTHAIVVSFDQSGNILWDHSFPIEDVLLPELEELVEVNVKEDRIELLYMEENLIRSKIVKGNEVLEGQSYTPVRLGSEEDEFAIKDPEVEGLEKWYQNTLYAYGEQEIEHPVANRFKSRRNVFYINKVRSNANDLPN